MSDNLRKRSLCALLIGAMWLASVSFVFVAPMRAQVRDVYDNGALGLGGMLRRLQTTASAMHTGAHPDDEDTPLIARLARGDGARVAYLSLNRGEGGQNIIGAELFESLGLIRTEELLQSRRLDGGEQLFTRAFDFGFTKTRAEAADRWNERLILGDMVRAIRLYRPLVIFARFSGTPADGHGQHQLAGYLTPLAFKAAADPAQFPEQITRDGLRPWQARKLFVGQGFTNNPANEPTLRVTTGDSDPLYGRSYYEIAAEGRSQQKSQEMGSLELRGAQSSGLRLLENVGADGSDNQSFFSGIDISLTGIARAANLKDGGIDDELKSMRDAAAKALKDYDAFAPARIIEPLADGLRAVRRARAKLTNYRGEETARYNADFMLALKEQEFGEALQRAANVTLDVLSDAETVAPGESFTVGARAFYDAQSKDIQTATIALQLPTGWTATEMPEPQETNPNPFRRRRETAPLVKYFRVTVAPDAAPTAPYWLDEPRAGDVFRWDANETARNLPFAAPILSAQFTLNIGGVDVQLKQSAQYRYADDIRGELRRDLNIVPAVSVAPDEKLLIVPQARDARSRRVVISVTSYAQTPVSGQLKLLVPASWTVAPHTAPFSLQHKGERISASFQVGIPANAADGSYRIGANAIADGGKTYERELRVVAYPHIQTHRYYTPAAIQTEVLNLKVAPVRVGYIMGSGDDVPAAIERMGLTVTQLTANDLTTGNLSRFDVVVVGIRASEVRPDFVANNNRVLDYVRDGGTLIVQYQRPDYAQLKLPPFPANMTQTPPTASAGSTARTIDENARVTILQPAHPAFNYPNKITDADWTGWVQERSLYNFTMFDPQYTPLLEAHDAGEPEQKGGEVYAEIGRGKYVYTSYAWFRQLPAGVPGAYRLFANLLSLGARKSPKSKVQSHFE